MKIYNPATEELIQEVEADTLFTLQRKFEELRKGQKIWLKTPIQVRIAKIKRFSEFLQEQKNSLAKVLHGETGKLLTEAHNEIKGACTRIQFFLDHTENVLQEKIVNESLNVQEILAFEPLGVVGNISAWNYPYLVGVNVLIPALLAGNAVLYKPSEYATLTGLCIEALLHQADIPKNVFSAAIGDGCVGKGMLDLPLNGYFFTGSYQTGKFISEAVAHKLVPVGLELGGKDPVYVMDDADNILEVAQHLVEGAFYNNGQSCCAVERIYVHERIYDAFLHGYVDEVKKIENPPPLTRPQHIAVLEEQVHDAVKKGAVLALGGKRMAKKGSFFEPTVLINVNHTMKVMRDESFGPIIGIQKVSSDEEGLQRMQDTEYGLTAGIYGRDAARARQLLQQMDVGTGYFNCCDRVSPYLPWSGRRHSGLGATLSYLGILSFVKPKGYMLRR